MLLASSVDILIVPALFNLVEKWSGAVNQPAAGIPPRPEPAPGD